MSTFGKLLRVTTFGESHGECVGGVIDGFPSKFLIDVDAMQMQLNRRRPGQSSISSPVQVV
jgi:chorismate synthase